MEFEHLKMAKPSAAVLAAKQEAVQRKKILNSKISSTAIKDIYQKSIDAETMFHKETGIVYDQFMTSHRCLWDEGYLESPERFRRVFKRCEELGLIKRCKRIASRLADHDEILLKHTPAHIDILKSTENCTDPIKLEEISSKYDAIFFHPDTYKMSLLAAGCTINLVESICKGDVQNGMAIIRPPGHHAMKAEYCGYCFFNNVAIAAELVLRNNLAKKVLIVDWDVHHGQATQRMFYNDPRVVYFSIHRYENGEFWPNLRESDYHYVGEQAGEGFNFNVPLNKTGMTDADYIAIFQQLLLPMAYEFQPDVIIISAGYDAAFGCPEGLMNITPVCYSHLLSSLLCLASGKVAVVLEGGYCLKSLAESAALTLRTLLGDPCPMLQPLQPPCKSIQETILNVIYSHKLYWKCFKYQGSYSINSNESKDECHMPIVSFCGFDTYQTVYETRNCYPVYSNQELEKINMELEILIQSINLSVAPNRLAVVYDTRMLNHCNLVDANHPEKPSRISSIFKKFQDTNILRRCCVLEGRVATEQEILLAHTPSYVNEIKSTDQADEKKLIKQSSVFNSVYLHPDTWNSALVSVGSLLQVVDSVMNRSSQAGIAIVRPPGHHAENDKSCGFCIFNNVAVAAKYAISAYNLKRVLIVDWDIHHGNGTQSIFEKDPAVLYISIHRFDKGSYFPNYQTANYSFVGTADGTGFNVNIPWNKKGMGDSEYVAAFQQIVMPIAYQFNPELVLVSAGFDACIGDPIGGCKVTPEMYGHMTHWLSSLANGRVILTLEGGYNINSISHAMTMCAKAFLGDPLMPLDLCQTLRGSALTTILNVLETQKNYWPNLVFQKSLPLENVIPKAKVPRSRPTVRSSSSKESEYSFLNGENERQLKSQQPEEEVVQLEIGLENLNFNEGCGSEGACAISTDSKLNGSSAPGTSYDPSTSASSGTSKTTLYHYLQALVDEKMFVVVPINDCPHLDMVSEVPVAGIDISSPCLECSSVAENWICLQCYTVHCARNIKEHALKHERSTQHPLTLSFSDVSVWCYACEAYVDSPRLYAARNAVHQKKFNIDLPWTYFDEAANSSHN